MAEQTGAAILLAAGFARRFGTDKRSFVLEDGRPLLQATVATYSAVFERLTVVMRPEDTELAAQVSDCSVTVANDAHLGMGHSLSAGMRSLQGVDFVFVGLGDMPFIETATLRRLVDAMTKLDAAAIVQPVYRKSTGHPVGFGHAHLEALAQLTGDVGAKSVVRAHSKQVYEVVVDDEGVIRDIDVPP